MRGVVAAATALVLTVVALGTALVWSAARSAGGDGTPLAATTTVGASADADYAVWEHNADATPVRWDPCSPILVEVAPANAYPGLVADVATALALLRDASGLDLVLAGTTDERPHGRRPAHREHAGGLVWAPVLVAAAAPHAHELPLRDVDRGIAIPLAVGTPGDRTYVSGQVVLNTQRDDLVPGFEDRAHSWGATVLHELAHILGLAHVHDADQLLSTFPGAGPVVLGEGDLAGLAAVGADGGCIEVPAARPVPLTPARDAPPRRAPRRPPAGPRR